jgi:hypothetical protein
LTVHDWDRAPVSVENLDDLVLDWDVYPRKSVDSSVAHRYALAYKAGSVFPPVKIGLFDGKKIIIDGAHRIGSRREMDLDHVDCAVLPFETKAELFAEAVKWNSDHGRPFEREEVKANIKRLKEFKFDVKDIVALTHVPASEIYREAAAAITVIRAPCGRKIYCNGTGQPDYRELIEFKRALQTIRDVAGSGCIPDDALFRDLVRQCRDALGKVKFNGKSDSYGQA